MTAYIDIHQASGLLNTGVLRLNKLVVRCKIAPSFGGGGKKGRRRHFSLRDVCRLGLAVWLSNAGLRAPAIRDILRRQAIKSLLSGLDDRKNVETEAKRRRLLVAAGFRGLENGYRTVRLVRSQRGVTLALRQESGVSVPIGMLLDDLAVGL
jgi:hypothetical protein